MSMIVPIVSAGRSLQLRRTIPNDAPLLFERGFSQREFMRLFRLNDIPASAAEVYQILARRHNVPPQQLRYWEYLILHRRHGPIGVCALADYSHLHRRAEYLVGLFDPAHRQAGYGLEATLMLLDLAFNTQQLHKLYATTYAYNHAAQKGLVSVGFVLEGQQREHVFDQVSQQFVDLCVYGMTVNVFRQNQRIVPLAQRLLRRDITQAMPPSTGSPPQSPTVVSGTYMLHSPRASP